MTIPYNSKEFGILKKLEEEFIESYFVEKGFLEKLKSKEISLEEVINIYKLKEKFKTKKINNSNEVETEKDFVKDDEKEGGSLILIPSKNILKENRENSTNSTYLTYKELYQLANIIRSTVMAIIPPFDELNKFFEQIIKILKIYNLPIF